ncbi:hypothetical protein ENHY17A_50082 [Moraxellaceae bacterium 17A]|nr:hypothetical protein ENHY17A_50082 [Moraxellaceae bacterium 17A]
MRQQTFSEQLVFQTHLCVSALFASRVKRLDGVLLFKFTYQRHFKKF